MNSDHPTRISIIIILLSLWSGLIHAQSFEVTLTAGDYSIQKSSDGYHKIIMDDFGTAGSEPGKPSLPGKIFLIALPPGVKATKIDIIGSRDPIEGEYKIEPSSPDFSYGTFSSQDIFKVQSQQVWEKNFKQAYSSNVFLPYQVAYQIGEGSLRNLPYIAVMFHPFAWQASTGHLSFCSSVTVTVTYASENALYTAIPLPQPFWRLAENLFVNFKQVSGYYSPAEVKTSDVYDYLVIVPQNNATSQAAIEPLISWKQQIGISTKIVDLTETGNTPQMIRSYLRSNYLNWRTIYVLLVGDVNSIPILNAYPAHPISVGSDWPVPTDYYYSELTYSDASSWDFDNDNNYGEITDDRVDLNGLADVFVGRIPFNPLTQENLIKEICQRTVAFEKDVGIWKNNTLLLGALAYNAAGSIMWDCTDQMEHIRTHFPSLNCVTLYEKEDEGIATPACDYPLNTTNVTAQWGTGNYGMIIWASHGSAKSAGNNRNAAWRNYKKSGAVQRDTFISDLQAGSLRGASPIVFAGSCDLGHFNDCLTLDLMENQAITAIMAASRTSYNNMPWMTFDFVGELRPGNILERSIGEAFYASKVKYWSYNGGPLETLEYANILTFCLFGDPSLMRSGVQYSGPAYITASANPVSIQADGSSTTALRAEIKDQNGNLVIDATNAVTFTLISGSNSGQLIGTNPVNAVNGIATITLQATTTPGLVTIEASSPGLTSGSTIVNVYNNPTEVGGSITKDTTWPLSSSPYVVTSDLTINSGVILTIEPGVTVKFNRDRDMSIYGALVANGTASAPINFTANATNPYARYWGGIKFYNSDLDNISMLNYCSISYGGQGGYGNFDRPLILNGYCNPTITNTTMSNNNRNGIDLETGTYTSDINLNITTLPYIFRGDIAISSGATMTLQPGVLIKLESGSDINIYGGLKARGTARQHIIFTSIRDDAYGGDTNGDGVTAGTPGDWGGVAFQNTAIDANCILEYCEMYYGGQGGYNNHDCPLELHPYVNPTIMNTNLAKNRFNGIDLWTGSYSSDILLNITNLPYMIRGDLRINEGACLAINPGALLKFAGSCDFYIYGGFMAQGTVNGHIIFTSLRDDAHGGDTNGDGVTSGSKGDWGGIWFDSKVNDAKCVLNYCDIMFAGQGGYDNLDSPLEIDARANPIFTNISLLNNTRNGIDVATGHYSSDIFLKFLNIPYMIRGDLVVESSATLTIDPGVILKFGGGCDFYIQGALKAQGNMNNEIIFTSLQDDSNGGDTNGDGTSVGSKGNWGGIQFYDSNIDNTSVLEYCRIIYGGCGGYGNNDSPLVLTGWANPTVINCILQNNTRNAINLLTGDYTSDFYLDILNFPYMVRGDLVVRSPAKLTLHPGVVLKFDGGCDFWIDGSLNAVGTSSMPIIFTSIKDDSIGGDSNGDGSSVGTPGDWGGIGFRDASDDYLCVLDNVKIFYAGCGGYGNHAAPLAFDNASPKIQRVTIEHSKSHGAICYNTASPDFGGGTKASQGQNKFYNFKSIANKYAFYNDGTADIYTRNNYWDTNDSLQIEKLIYDKVDHSGKGRVYFYPFNSAADILSPQVTVVIPNGGENWIIGSKQTVIWSAIDNEGISKVCFSLSRDGGLTFARFDSLFSNPGVLNWTVAGPFSNNCKIKIQAFDFSGNMGYDVSNGNFAIVDTTGMVNHPPTAPSVLLPINGEESRPDDYLVWTRSTDPDMGDVITYTLELDNNSNFTSPEIHQSGISGVKMNNDAILAKLNEEFATEIANAVYIPIMSLQNFNNLKDDSTYYWRVKAVDNYGAESNFTSGLSHFFFNKTNTAPQPVIAGFSPKDGIEVRTNKPEISWHPAKDADFSDYAGTLRYKLQLDDDGEFINNYKYQYTTEIGLNTIEVPDPLTENVKWYYRVQAMDDEGLTSAWSPVENFWVNAVDDAPVLFALLHPTNNGTITTDTLNFSWESTFDVDPNDKITFTLEYSTNISFTENLVAVKNLTDTCFAVDVTGFLKTAYYWRVKAVDSDGLVTWGSNSGATPWSFIWGSTDVIDGRPSVPQTFAIMQNHPNPFNPETTIDYQLPIFCHVAIIIYNTIGQEIRTLIDGEQQAGYHQITWDGKDNSGKPVGTGIYLYQLKAENFWAIRKMMLIQ